MKRNMIESPTDLQEALPQRQPVRKRAIGIDLGTNCGLSIFDFTPTNPGYTDLHVILGQMDLSLADYDAGPLRHVRLMQYLEVLQPNFVAFEDVKFTASKDMFKGPPNIGAILARVSRPTEFLGGLKMTVGLWCELHGVPASGYGINVIKKFATMKGNANKMDVIRACNARFQTDFPDDEDVCLREGIDNIADAAFVGLLGLSEYSDAIKYAELYGIKPESAG